MEPPVYQNISEITQIDLFHHALIEASAGTGKTFTIENLVVRLLLERPDIHLGNILMVTFTEKATSELKSRIRENLEKKLEALTGNDAEKIKQNLQTFETAPIFTIHGFCNSVLRDFAFENSSPFELEMVDNTFLYEMLLKEQVRKDWPAYFGDCLYDILIVSNFHLDKEKFFNRIIKVAGSYREIAGDRLIPGVNPDSVSDILEKISYLKVLIEKLKALSDHPEGLCYGFESLNYHKTDKDGILTKLIIPLRDCLENRADKNESSWLSSVFTLLSPIKEKRLHPRENRKGVDFSTCPQFPEFRKIVLAFLALCKTLRFQLTAWSAKRLIRDLQAEKQRRGLISYDDMILRVYNALTGPSGNLLTQRLRTIFKIAFVDEFQDTDSLQWRIFKKLFIGDIEVSHPTNTLYVIGDPKQAIYGFRGADVYAYMEARHVLENLSKKGLANLYSLSFNWRSSPEMIAVFNRLFSTSDWFISDTASGPFDIPYREVSSPGTKYLPETMVADDTGSPCLTIVDLSECYTAREAKKTLADFIAGEIVDIVESSAIFLKRREGRQRALDLGDIAVLVRNKNEMPFLEEAFQSRDISFATYRKPGLFFSQEAFHLSLLLHAALDPSHSGTVKKALLTPFFGFTVGDLWDYDSYPTTHAAKQMVIKWYELAQNRRWSHLFQSMMEETGICFRESGNPGWDRAFTNYRQLLEQLQTAAHRQNLDIRGLCALLENYRKKVATAGPDSDIHEIDTESRKVQLMTMHVSKGLEYPVVFIAGGLTQGTTQNLYHEFHETASDGSGSPVKTLDLTCAVNPSAHKKERKEEDLRLYYVSLTRAKFKLYLPFYTPEKKTRMNGPVRKFLSCALATAFTNPEKDASVRWMSSGSSAMKKKAVGSISDIPDKPPTAAHQPYFPTQPSYNYRKTFISSFSEIHDYPRFKGTEFQPEDFSVDETPLREEVETAFSNITAPLPDPDMDRLPGGADVGSMLHDILENISFGTVDHLKQISDAKAMLKDTACSQLIRSHMDKYRIPRDFENDVVSILWDTLTTPVSHLAATFSLSRLKREDRLHEVEFYYPFAFPLRRDPGIKAIQLVDGFLMGFVDLIFQHEGQYYIADWKSNRLGNGYHQDSLTECMVEAGYDLQYKIYAVAMIRWLKSTLGSGFDFETHFGGIFYFFLRGMGQGGDQGIYHVPGHLLGSPGQIESEIIDTLTG
jgi:exodeoxyribonuclease V beta subunit